MSSLAGLHQVLDAVSLAEDAGDHGEAVDLIHRWLDGAYREMVGGESLEVKCWHSELSGAVDDMLTRIESLRSRGAFPRPNGRLSDDHFAKSIEEEVHERWKTDIERAHKLFQDKMAALEREARAEARAEAARQPPSQPIHNDDSVLEDVEAIDRAHIRQREQEAQDLEQALKVSREEQEAREYEQFIVSKQSEQQQFPVVQAVDVRGRTGRDPGRACCWCCGRAGQARDSVLTATLIDHAGIQN